MAQYFEIIGSERAMDSLNRFLESAENFQGVAPDVHRFLLKHTKDVFRTEGQAGGVKWPQYAGNDEKYGAFKAGLLKRRPQLLRWSAGRERLYPSLTDERHPEHVFAVSGRSMRFGTKVPYAWRHQHGKGIGPFGEMIPKREFLVLGPRGVAEIRRIISRYMGI